MYQHKNPQMSTYVVVFVKVSDGPDGRLEALII